MIPFVDLSAQYESIQDDIQLAINGVLTNTQFVGGHELREFESEFAEYCEVTDAVGVGNGTDALRLALLALDIGPGDEVIIPSHTFFATSEAVSSTGATPVFAEILEGTMLVDPSDIERLVTTKTKAIIPVHLNGQICDMDRISAIGAKHDLAVIEDAAQAHGSRWKGKRAGSLGTVGCFSFYPSKNLGAYGDGGAVVSNDAAIVTKVRMLANHGRQDKYLHQAVGVNSRLDNLQAAILRVKLRRLDQWNNQRRALADRYRESLSDSRLLLPEVSEFAEPVWHLYVVRSADRDSLRSQLSERGISTGMHYPVPAHAQPVYALENDSREDLPITGKVTSTILSLPMYPEMTEQQLMTVVDAVYDIQR